MPTRRVTLKSPESTLTLPAGADLEAMRQLQTMPPSSSIVDDDPDGEAELELGEHLRAVFGNDPGAHARISIYRVNDRTKKREFCGNYTPDQFRDGGVELVKQDFGSGDFEYRAYGSAGLITRGSFSIAETRVNPIVASPASSNVEKVLESLAQGQAALLSALTQKPDPQSQMMQTMEMMRLMREVMGPTPSAAPQTQSLLDQLSTLRALKEFMKEEKDETPSDPDNPISMLAPILEVVREGMKTRTQNPSSTETVPMITTPASLHAQTTASVSDTDDEKIVRAIVTELLTMAEAGKPVSQAGEYLFQYLPESAIAIVRSPACVTMLTSAVPELVKHAKWLTDVRVDCLARFDAAG